MKPPKFYTDSLWQQTAPPPLKNERPFPSHSRTHVISIQWSLHTKGAPLYRGGTDKIMSYEERGLDFFSEGNQFHFFKIL